MATGGRSASLEAVHADSEQVGDPREGHGHRVHVHPGDVADDAEDGVRVRRSCCGCGVQVVADCVEQERPGAASRVEDALGQRVGHNMGDDLLGEPVRRVVLAEPVPLAGADHRFVQDLHDVVLDLVPGEPVSRRARVLTHCWPPATSTTQSKKS